MSIYTYTGWYQDALYGLFLQQDGELVKWLDENAPQRGYREAWE